MGQAGHEGQAGQARQQEWGKGGTGRTGGFGETGGTGGTGGIGGAAASRNGRWVGCMSCWLLSIHGGQPQKSPKLLLHWLGCMLQSYCSVARGSRM